LLGTLRNGDVGNKENWKEDPRLLGGSGVRSFPELKSLIISSDTCSQPQTLVHLENQLFALLAPRVHSWIRVKPTSEDGAGFMYVRIS
ncbi:hypothetical protein KUCAC02_026473, partial [Chaenocephalus aceratus]